MIPAERRLLVLLLALFGLLYAWRLAAVELSDIDECRSGTIVRDMTAGGHRLLPRTPDGYLMEKPPAYYGLCAAASAVAGLNEWSLRGVSVLLAVGTLALTWTLARLYGSPRAAALAVVALGSNVIFMTWARMAYVDMAFTFFLTAGLVAYAAARAGRLGARPAAALCGAAFGLATLSKGPLGIALPLAVVGGDLLVSTRGRFWRARASWGAAAASLVLALGVACLWYVPGWLRGGDEFLKTCVLSENFFMPLGQARDLGVSHRKPFWDYPQWQVLTFLPVLPLLPETVRWLCRREDRSGCAPLAAWFVFGFCLFMSASNKRRYYLLPLQPAVAVMIGLAVARRLDDAAPSPFLRWGAYATGVVVVLAGVLGLALGLAPPERLAAIDPRLPPIVESVPWPLRLASAGLLGAGGWLLAVRMRRPIAVARAAAAAAVMLVAARSFVYIPAMAAFNHTRPFVEAMTPHVPTGTRPVLLGALHAYGFDFYWPGGLDWDAGKAPTAAWLLAPRSMLGRIPGDFVLVGGTSFRDPADDAVLLRRR